MVRSPTDGLRLPLHSISDASRGARLGGLPYRPGYYAWWVDPEAMPDVPTVAHPDESVGLLYVGIAPSRPISKATLRSRVLGQHVGGNTGSSTFRRSLAALLFEEQGWEPVKTATREVLSQDDNNSLSAWQRRHLRVAWIHVEMPWVAEATIIGEMQPPLNLADNTEHPFHATLSEARRRFRALAKPSQPS